MPFHIPAHRQSFRVYDASLYGPAPEFDTAFQLVVAAKQEPELVEHALAHLRFVHTNVGIDWADVLDMVDARRGPAYGAACVVRGCEGHISQLRRELELHLHAARRALIFVQLVSVEDHRRYTLQRLDEDTTALFADFDADIVFTSTYSPRESHAVLVAFHRPDEVGNPS